MQQKSGKVSASAAQPLRSIRTAYLFAVLVTFSTLLVWANNEFVMTKEVFQALAGNPGNTTHLDVQYEAVRRMSVWGYAIAPIQTAFRISLVTLIVQMTCLLGGVEIPFGRLFRISAVAFAATLFGSFLQLFWIVLQPVAAIDQATLGIVPDSLAAWLSVSSDIPLLVYLSLSRVSITSLLWMLLLYWGLRETNRLKAWGATMVAVSTWGIVSALQVGTSLFLKTLVS